MGTIEIMLILIYAIAGFITFLFKVVEEDDGGWRAIASGLIWPVFLVKAIFQVITEL